MRVRYFIGSLFILLLIACENVEVKKNVAQAETTHYPAKFYSKEVKDTFFVFVSVPKSMDKNKKYPVIYLLDANLYFDVMASAFRDYTEVGLLPEAILVGIGYKDIYTMDSLRNRDLTFPKAIAEYEMPISGKANTFLSFINAELIPHVDSRYPCDKTKRVLMGHSLGGYFTLFALNKNLSSKNDIFHAYIAASPALHYNHYYLLKEFNKLQTGKQMLPKAFVTYGGLEDEEEDRDMGLLKREVVLQQLTNLLSENNKIHYKGEIYSNIDHMNMAFPTFLKGIQWCFGNEDTN